MTRSARCLVSACLLAALMLSGCAMFNGSTSPGAMMYPHAMKENLTELPQDHYARVSAILAHDRRALIDDLDLLFMTDRQGRLSRWHDR